LPKKYREALPSVDKSDENGRRRTEKNEISDEMFTKKHEFSRRHPVFRNVEMLNYFIIGLPKKAIKFFAGIITPNVTNLGLSNSMITRSKFGDPPQKLAAMTITDQISDIFLEGLAYDKPRESGHSKDLYSYWFCTMSFIHSVLIGGISLDNSADKRPRPNSTDV
jgi:hypothetical protein